VIVLVIGGAGSGKSVVAERKAAALPPPVTYVATWVPDEGDPDMLARVAAHRVRRPAAWGVREVGLALPTCIEDVEGTVLVDALGTWVAGFEGAEPPADDLCRALVERHGDSVVVSDEVGLGVHPSSTAGRRFRDTLGSLNQAVAAVADEVWLVVAGRAVALEPTPW
jgi:adenosyl cobinamide kinase/adenosyl cobinamide phosphate guanylyltransferase